VLLLLPAVLGNLKRSGRNHHSGSACRSAAGDAPYSQSLDKLLELRLLLAVLGKLKRSGRNPHLGSACRSAAGDSLCILELGKACFAALNEVLLRPFSFATLKREEEENTSIGSERKATDLNRRLFSYACVNFRSAWDHDLCYSLLSVFTREFPCKQVTFLR
jgi:hypothetical protein